MLKSARRDPWTGWALLNLPEETQRVGTFKSLEETQGWARLNHQKRTRGWARLNPQKRPPSLPQVKEVHTVLGVEKTTSSFCVDHLRDKKIHFQSYSIQIEHAAKLYNWHTSSVYTVEEGFLSCFPKKNICFKHI